MGASSGDDSFMDVFVPFLMVFGGCCGAMVFFELALKETPGCGNFLTFTEMAFLVFECSYKRMTTQSPDKKTAGLLRPLVASRGDHLLHAMFWVTMNWLVNFVYQFNIGVPTHTTIRACNVLTTVCLGFLIFGERYSALQCFAGLLVTGGIIVASLADAMLIGKCGASTTVYGCLFDARVDQDVEKDMARWSIGIILLIACLLVQGMLGHTQKRIYDKYLQDRNKHPGLTKNDLADEFLFTSVFLSLLGTVPFHSDIVEFSRQAMGTRLLMGILPMQFVWILFNNIAQACCIKGVFRLYTRHSTLAVNITLSVRKFLTVVISVVVFGNSWSTSHTIGAVFVFTGAFLYSSGGLFERKEKAKKT